MDVAVRTQLRFEASYAVDSETGCWRWCRLVNAAGYSKFFYYGKLGYGHRYAWEYWRGAIPAGLTIDHLCRNRCCVNPDHLDVVSLRTNLMRGNSLSTINARKTHCPRGHPLDNRQPPAGGRRCKTCNRLQSRAFRERHPGYRQRYPNQPS